MEDGELPRVPVAFSLAPGKAAAPQKAAPAALEAAHPAELPEKGSAAPASGNASITPHHYHALIPSSIWPLFCPTSLWRIHSHCTEALRAWRAPHCDAGSGRFRVGLCTR